MLHTNRLGQGLPISTIIIALLGLIVLIILIVLVQTQITKTSKGLKNVSENVCSPPNAIKPMTDCDDIIYGSFTNLQPGQVCCRPVK